MLRRRHNKNILIYYPFITLLLMNFFRRQRTNTSNISVKAAKTTSTTTSMTPIDIESRLRGALWGYFSGDALAAPTHWYYGGKYQIQQEYGGKLIQDYTKPNHELRGSILNKSNINGGGRSSSYFGSSSSSSSSNNKSIIGDIINHGKKELWSPSKNIHYHATLQKGENTLEVQLGRLVMKSIVDNNGMFNEDHFRNLYIKFMTTPNSHNDTYASTCHRMFFANYIFHNKRPKDCPDNDHHNVDAIDGLVLPTIVALAISAKELSTTTTCSDDSEERINKSVSEGSALCAAITRESNVLQKTSALWGLLLKSSLQEGTNNLFFDKFQTLSKRLIGRNPNPNIQSSQCMTACYLQQSVPTLLDMTSKYIRKMIVQEEKEIQKQQARPITPENSIVWEALLDNANVGGENVHRGSVFGAILGARVGMEGLPAHLREGLYHHKELANEIDTFVKVVLQQD